MDERVSYHLVGVLQSLGRILDNLNILLELEVEKTQAARPNAPSSAVRKRK